MKCKNLIVLLSVIIYACSCNNGGIESSYCVEGLDSLERVLKLKDDTILQLRSVLSEYENSPERLCYNVDTFFKQNNITKLQSIGAKLKKYHPYSSELKRVDSLICVIENTRKQHETELQETRNKAIDKLTKRHDDVSNILWMSNPYFTHYNNMNRTSIYIGKSDYSVWMRLKMSYEGEDWIFFDYAYLSYDGNTISIPFDKYKDRKSDNSGGYVWEWIDVKIDEDIIDFLKMLVKGNNPKMRLSGKYSHTRTLTQNEIKGIADVLMAYDVLVEKQ